MGLEAFRVDHTTLERPRGSEGGGEGECAVLMGVVSCGNNSSTHVISLMLLVSERCC